MKNHKKDKKKGSSLKMGNFFKEVKSLYKFITFLLSLSNLFVTTVFIAETRGMEVAIKSETVEQFYLLNLILSIVILLMLLNVKNENKNIHFGNVKVNDKVFLQLAEKILLSKEELKEFELGYKKEKDKMKLIIKATPNIEKEVFSFSEFSNLTAEEIIKTIKDYTTYENLEVFFEFKTISK